jgi:hypothetical protein
MAVCEIKRQPAQDQAAALGWTTPQEARAIMVHVAQCLACRALLERDEEIRRRLALLRDREPSIDVLQQVMERIDTEG